MQIELPLVKSSRPTLHNLMSAVCETRCVRIKTTMHKVHFSEPLGSLQECIGKPEREEPPKFQNVLKFISHLLDLKEKPFGSQSAHSVN